MGRPKGSYLNYYAVYRKGTDELICTGNSEECCKIMGVTFSTFRSYVSRHNHGVWCPYEFYVDSLKEEQ